MKTKKLVDSADEDIVAAIGENSQKVRQFAALLVDEVGLIVRDGRIEGRTNDQIFRDVVTALTATPGVDMTTGLGAVLAIVAAEFALRVDP